MIETHAGIRDTARCLSKDFSHHYWQAKDRDRACSPEFVTTLNKAGSLSGSAHASGRKVFSRSVGENQGVPFSIARAPIQLSTAALMVDKAAANRSKMAEIF